MFELDRLGAWGELEFFSRTLPDIQAQIAADTRTVLPPSQLVFNALERVQPNDVRVVILGQDPYHTVGKADGLAFSITADFGGRLDSLGNILKELRDDTGTVRTRTQLDDWADQGVLLLNTILTVPEGLPKGHAKLGWQTLTGQILRHLATAPRAYLLWGGPAHKAAQEVEASMNFKLLSSHPSPLGVTKRGATFEAFRGSKPFSRTNAWLRSQGHGSINWSDPEAL
ncbi:uracil-DNA glycosylase [Sulfitobacter guttiformis]|uniref:Uracil-DNA glycosylase n=1 Tax=Sulfitobacter guttiformis TaxID=74349 RepID=A0A420DMY7_9RHOB|nr:uracil-DNA glycosylase [Sulfitobacter guttiformis]KIN72913.1 Uracil-DNA glycosylase [Sulfitobacter guttiformis KCTC 32187]RKE95602.1 uracil-DNA glycosylase [Sulfitobacter guttiformis]